MYTVEGETPKSWDDYFLNLCKTIALNSKCLSRKIGACIIKDKTIISTGYNGPSRGIETCDKRWLYEQDKGTHMGRWLKENITGNDPKDKLYETSDLFIKFLEGKCPRYIMGFKSGIGLEWCVAGHAERNAIVNAAREGMPSLKGCSLYMTCGIPCKDCLVEIINAGIIEIIVTDISFYDQSSKYLLDKSKLKYRKYEIGN